MSSSLQFEKFRVENAEKPEPSPPPVEVDPKIVSVMNNAMKQLSESFNPENLENDG